MEHIRQAVELAKASGRAVPVPIAADLKMPRSAVGMGGESGSGPAVTALDPAHLESMRIVAHDVMDRRAKAYDMLRTQVLRTMEHQKWQLLAVTSPTPGCGKTLTAINLALSIARQPEKSALLIDLDLQRPRVADSLGLKCDKGLISVLEERTTLADAVIRARIGKTEIAVLPCEQSTSYSSEWMASRQMSNALQAIRRDYSSHVVICDLPPILPSDDVISIMPQLDCALLVAAVGVSTLSEIEQCNRHLQSVEVARVVLNKASKSSTGYYY